MAPRDLTFSISTTKGEEEVEVEVEEVLINTSWRKRNTTPSTQSVYSQYSTCVEASFGGGSDEVEVDDDGEEHVSVVEELVSPPCSETLDTVADDL